jgi:hypothetical protein
MLLNETLHCKHKNGFIPFCFPAVDFLRGAVEMTPLPLGFFKKDPCAISSQERKVKMHANQPSIEQR